jgi:predicted Rossmann-fold nucleotide-binding protein
MRESLPRIQERFKNLMAFEGASKPNASTADYAQRLAEGLGLPLRAMSGGDNPVMYCVQDVTARDRKAKQGPICKLLHVQKPENTVVIE